MHIRKVHHFLSQVENERGSVLLTTYLLITVLLLLGTAFLIVSSNDSRTSEIQRKATQAFYIAEAGIERAIYDLKEDYTDNQNWSDGTINGWTVDSSDTDADGFYPLPDASDPANAAYPTTSLGDGSYSVSLMNGAGSDGIWVRSTGSVDDVSQTILIYLAAVSLSPWDNAIFGGAGSSGAMVNGNVKIHGSVHILGNGLADGDNAIDLGGTAELVGNNYAGLESSLKDKVPDLPTVTFGGEVVETLNAELRVKKGLVGLSGNSQVGAADNPGDSDKETVDGVYVTDGFNGTKGTASVFSDNGYSEAYDLGDSVSFPTLDDDIAGYDSYYDYFAAEGYTLAAGEMATVANLSGATSDFTYGDCATNCISMTSGQLYVKGKLYVNGGTLGITGSTVEYTGTGTILVTGNVSINEDLLTVGDDSFPTNIMAVMTPGNITMGTGAGAAQLDVMGLFYAEGEVTSAKQTDLMGTIVTNYFNVSNQVPSIWQVPETANNLPDGLIGGDTVYLMRVISWQKIDNPA